VRFSLRRFSRGDIGAYLREIEFAVDLAQRNALMI
jgi:hypothetical protein